MREWSAWLLVELSSDHSRCALGELDDSPSSEVFLWSLSSNRSAGIRRRRYSYSRSSASLIRLCIASRAGRSSTSLLTARATRRRYRCGGCRGRRNWCSVCWTRFARLPFLLLLLCERPRRLLRSEVAWWALGLFRLRPGLRGLRSCFSRAVGSRCARLALVRASRCLKRGWWWCTWSSRSGSLSSLPLSYCVNRGSFGVLLYRFALCSGRRCAVSWARAFGCMVWPWRCRVVSVACLFPRRARVGFDRAVSFACLSGCGAMLRGRSSSGPRACGACSFANTSSYAHTCSWRGPAGQQHS